MIAVTGMHRSGTSCVMGLLTRCGLSMGTSHELFNEPRFDNPKGHFENKGAMYINELIVQSLGATWSAPPAQTDIMRIGHENGWRLRQFNDTFNGDIFKDPRICLTIGLWEAYCPRLQTVVFCLRNPWGVAYSLQRRDAIACRDGLQLWLEYNVRFLLAVKRCRVFIVDYDALQADVLASVTGLCRALELPLTSADIAQRCAGFFEPELNHDPDGNRRIDELPPDVLAVYQSLKKRAGI